MHSFKAKRLLLISAPSNLVYLLDSVTSFALSLPAKSINDILLYITFSFSCEKPPPYPPSFLPTYFDSSYNVTYNMAWDLED